MSVTHLPISGESRDRLFGHAEALLSRALENFSREFDLIKATMESDLIAHYADLYSEALALIESYPVNSKQGLRARQLMLKLTHSIACAIAREQQSLGD
ncbi:hypothetical protein [Pleomorphomonas sp. PLEO]|uniref:hypothetical protein n=1 Tax=Pleomorphomonas sp. PLEO TaxID=3239306 RepID=UPI00351F2F03